MVEKQCKGGSGPAKASQGSCLSRLTLSSWIETCGCHDWPLSSPSLSLSVTKHQALCCWSLELYLVQEGKAFDSTLLYLPNECLLQRCQLPCIGIPILDRTDEEPTKLARSDGGKQSEFISAKAHKSDINAVLTPYWIGL